MTGCRVHPVLDVLGVAVKMAAHHREQVTVCNNPLSPLSDPLNGTPKLPTPKAIS